MVFRLLRQPGCPFKLSIWLTVCILSYRAQDSATVSPTFIMFRCVYCNVFFWNWSRKPCGDCSWYQMQCLVHGIGHSSRKHYSDFRVHKEKVSPREDYIAHYMNTLVEDFSKVIGNFQKATHISSNITHGTQVLSRQLVSSQGMPSLKRYKVEIFRKQSVLILTSSSTAGSSPFCFKCFSSNIHYWFWLHRRRTYTIWLTLCLFNKYLLSTSAFRQVGYTLWEV